MRPNQAQGYYPMTAQELNNLFESYNIVLYVGLKWTISMPAILAGNIADLATLGISKNLINVTPLMNKFPFFRTITRDGDGESILANSSFFNKGFAGVCRATAAIVGEIPFNLAAVLLASILTVLHVVIANTIGVPVVAVANYVANNMCGANH